MSISIRETKDEDFPQISILLKKSKMDAYITEKKFSDMLIRNKGCCYVAVEEGNIVGSVFGVHDGAFIGYIRKLVVSENYRRKGIATMLAQKVIAEFDKVGIPLIFVHIEKENVPSIALFKSLGFGVKDSHYFMETVHSPKTN